MVIDSAVSAADESVRRTGQPSATSRAEGSRGAASRGGPVGKGHTPTLDLREIFNAILYVAIQIVSPGSLG
jgi:hypothetical protein